MANFDLVRRKGSLIAVGNASGVVEPIAPLKLSAKNLKLVRPRQAILSFLATSQVPDTQDGSMVNYITTAEESDRYTKELWTLVENGVFKIRICSEYPFTAEGAQQAQKELTTPGGKLAGKIIVKISDD